jgi:hypothetical protein
VRLPNGLVVTVVGTAVSGLLMVWLVIPAFAQQSANRGMGVPNDWTHQHVVFSNPGTFQEAMKNGTYDQWVQIVNDSRYQLQQLKRKATLQSAEHRSTNSEIEAEPLVAPQGWSMYMGAGATVGPGQYPAKWSFSTTTAFCDSDPAPDFVVYNTGLTGSSANASIIAYDNLYSGCAAPFPRIYWQYNTAGGTISTSPVLTTDGTQVAFIQSTSSVASLVLLKWAKNSSLVTLSSVPASGYRSCTAPCMTVLTLNGSPNVTRSAVYYDYSNDVLYVGDDSGTLHKFTNIFVSGTPAEVIGGGTSSGWPQTVSAGNILTGPVYDGASDNVLVGSSGGMLIRIPSSGGSSNFVVSGKVANGSGIADAPILDSQAGSVYVFAFCDTTNTCADNGHRARSAVFQFPVSFVGGSTGTERTFGQTYGSTILYAGGFDNLYYSSGSQTGNLYICGAGYALNANQPTLYQVPLTSNVMGTAVTGPWLSPLTGCSPVTEFLNGPTDWIFLSTHAEGRSGSPINCPSDTISCVMSFDVTSGAGFGTSKATNATATAVGGTSGIIIDNSVSSPAGTSNVYFTPLGNESCAGNGITGSGHGGCAVQASQAGLD